MGLVYLRNTILPQEKPSLLNVVVFPFPFHIFVPLAKLRLIRLQGQFPILRTKSCPDLYPIIRPLRRPLALVRGRILIPRFIRFPKLVVWDVAHSLSLPLGRVGRGFVFTEDETRRNFLYLSCTFREVYRVILVTKSIVILDKVRESRRERVIRKLRIRKARLQLLSGFCSYRECNDI